MPAGLLGSAADLPFPALTQVRRQTPQRRAIRAVLSRSRRPLSPQEILDQARDESPQLGLATVYRNVKDLVGLGWLDAVELPGAPDRYERAGRGHHHHFHCRACDRVFDIEACPDEVQNAVEEMSPGGFEVDAHEIILYGTCSTCTG